MKSFDQIKAKIAELEPDVAKTEAGNASAGTRLRKGMSEIKALAHTVRADALELRGK